MIVINLFLTLLHVAFWAGLALACITIPLLALKAVSNAIERRLKPPDPPPRNLTRETRERQKHETHMGR